MASVKRRTDDRPKPWLVRWRDEAGADRKKSFARKADADRFRAEVEHSLNDGSYIDPKAGKITFQQYAEGWRAAQQHRPNTAARKKSLLFKHVYPAIGGRQLVTIRHSTMQAFITGLSPDLAPSSIETVFRTVRAIYSAAKRDRLIKFDPCADITLPELPRVKVVPLTTGEVSALASAVKPRYRGLVEFDAGTGLRQGEVFGVEVDDINRTDKTLTVERQLQPAAGGGVVVCPLKNRHSYRTVPLGKAMFEVIDAHLAAYPPVAVEVLDVTGPKPVTRSARFVFLDDAGRPLNRNSFNESVWRPAREQVGLPEATQHDLRHFYASLLIRAGLNPKVVAERLGHRDATLTLNTYSHLWPDDDDRSRQAIDDVFERDVPHMRPKEQK
ncbi:site-specific integrase [Micromonospora sp. STR1_7]|uniref:Site-specific integrase n=1 Tax=Micromonospora parastrephiae TaxID=2806101 RepID=A0ABS1XUE9_9ACTN|nr:site-specific integrase [Micromonospora parastrephiae]MBM0232881.1 site-specific integrase [Micromonospora parastrephiae]